jgi:periplasmic divalent cation tolerance protein
MVETTTHALVIITCGSEDEARSIARQLVGVGLVAGAQIVPIASLYTWQGEVVEDDEWLLICKAVRPRYAQIEEAVMNLHSYEVAPIYMVAMTEGSRPYLDWIDEVTGS